MPDLPIDEAKKRQIKKMTDRVREMYRLGIKANTNRLSTTRFAESNTYPPRVVRQAKQFAEKYSEDQVEWLCGLRRPNGLPLHFKHIIFLLTLDSAKDRRKWAAAAAKHGWSAPTLHQQIKATLKRSTGHGRSVVVPTSRIEALSQLKRDGDLWAKRCEAFVKLLGSNEPESGTSQKDIRNATSELFETIDRVRKCCSAVTKTLRS